MDSFRRVKLDMMNLWNSISYIKQENDKLKLQLDSEIRNRNADQLEFTKLNLKISELQKSQDNLRASLSGVISLINNEKVLILNKNNNKLHESHCPFAKRIKSENQIVQKGDDLT